MQRITNWMGRFGNAIQQLTNSIHYCKQNNISFASPQFNYIQDLSIRGVRRVDAGVRLIDPIAIPGDDSKFTSDFFYHTGRDRDHDVTNQSLLESERRNICMNYILPYTFLKEDQEPLDRDHLVIHIRSGDIMDVNRFKKIEHVYLQYKTNPISFYTSIIPRFERVSVVTNNKDCFVIKNLVEKFNHIELVSGNIKDDMSYITRARNLVSSGVGTFPVSLALLSKYIESYYCTNLELKYHINSACLESFVNINKTQIREDYLPNGWRNNKIDIQQVISYEL